MESDKSLMIAEAEQMSDVKPAVELPAGWQILTPEEQAIRAKFAEITGEDPRSHQREVEYRAAHPTPVKVHAIFGALKRALTEEAAK